MDSKSPEVRETQVLGSQDGFGDEKKGRMDSFPWLQSKKKQCSLDSVHKHGWKPLTLSAPVLFSFVFVSLILAVIIEILTQQSQLKGGLALSTSADDTSAFIKFCYLFLPTIIAVIYSLLWGWVDLDVKRIQPWFEMSKLRGATAECSIFLEYPYDFVAFAPLRAAKRKHWGVFYGGTVTVIIFWLITPLQSTILGSGPIKVDMEITTSTLSVPRPASQQMELMDQSILNEGYALTWLNQQYPPYMTPDYMVLPFGADVDAPQTPSTNLTGSTTKYWTDINCWPAEMSTNGPVTKHSLNFINGQGCNASEISPYGSFKPTTPYKMMYIGYQISPYVDYSLQNPQCSKAAFHQFLAIWARYNETIDSNPNDLAKVTAMFCETNYYKQQVNITISTATKAPIDGSLVPTGPRETLSEKEFNITAFEYLLGAGVAPDETRVEREYPFNHILQQHPRVQNKGLTWPMSPMVGFAIGTQNATSLDAFQDETLLSQAFNASHKMVFSLAMRRVLTNSSTEAAGGGTIHFEQHGIIVSRLFSAIVEGLLLVVAIFTIMLWWHTKKATSKLTEDPASLGSIMSICQNSTTLLDKFAGKGCLPEEVLTVAFEDEQFQLVCGCQDPSGQMVIKVVNVRQDFIESQRISLPEPEPELSVGHYSPVKPLALRREIGLLVILAMMAAAAGLTYLKVVERRDNGLSRPSTNFEVLQILENYIPTVFATLLEPFWVLLNRLWCIIQPFRDLWNGHKPAKGSINARYTSVPPQMVFWRAAKSGHFLLSALCMIALLSNLLAVGLGALFNELPIMAAYPREFRQSMTFELSDTTMGTLHTRMLGGPAYVYEEPSLVTMYNISEGTALPPWTNKDMSFAPFTADVEDTVEGDTHTATSRGFGIVPRCIYAGTYRTQGRGPTLNETLKENFEPIDGCPWKSEFGTAIFNWANYRSPAGPSALEMTENLAATNGSCGKPLILGWGRSSQLEDLENGEMESTFVICRPTFTTAMFNVTVDTEGYVLNTVQVSDSQPDLDYPDSTRHTDQIVSMLNTLLSQTGNSWHNDTLSFEWMNYLLKIRPGNQGLTDPNAPLPDAAALIPDIEAVYRQLFALVFSLNPNIFLSAPTPATIRGTLHRTDTRIFMNDAALIISLAVLGINIVVALLIYGRSIVHFLPRMPTTVGSIIAYLAPSRAMREYTPLDMAHGRADDDNGGGGRLQMGAGGTFSFGRFVGDDGRAHVGIELDPYVVPVHLKSLRKGDTQPQSSMLRRLLRRKGTSRTGDTWL